MTTRANAWNPSEVPALVPSIATLKGESSDVGPPLISIDLLSDGRGIPEALESDPTWIVCRPAPGMSNLIVSSVP